MVADIQSAAPGVSERAEAASTDVHLCAGIQNIYGNGYALHENTANNQCFAMCERSGWDRGHEGYKSQRRASVIRQHSSSSLPAVALHLRTPLLPPSTVKPCSPRPSFLLQPLRSLSTPSPPRRPFAARAAVLAARRSVSLRSVTMPAYSSDDHSAASGSMSSTISKRTCENVVSHMCICSC